MEKLWDATKWRLKPALPRVKNWRDELVRLADVILPNSRAEADQIIRLFRAPADGVCVVPNGVDPRFRGAGARLVPVDPRSRLEFVLYAGRIEPRKNVLGLLLAARRAGTPVVLIGDAPPGHEAYHEACRRAGRGIAAWYRGVDHDDPLLASALAAARVFALPSWFETPGLAALEAALASTAVVVTPLGSTREYFGDLSGNMPGPTESEKSPLQSTGRGRRVPGPACGRESAVASCGRRSRDERRRPMTKSPARPRPVRTGRYRYTKWRWRILVGAIDALGGLAAGLASAIRPIRPQARSSTNPGVSSSSSFDHLGDAVLTSPLVSGIRAAYPNAVVDVVASPSNREVFEANPDVDRVHLASRN